MAGVTAGVTVVPTSDPSDPSMEQLGIRWRGAFSSDGLSLAMSRLRGGSCSASSKSAQRG